MFRFASLPSLVAAALLSGCAAHQRPPELPLTAATATGQVWIVSNGFHSSIAVRAQDAPVEMRRYDPTARYFVVGWGGRDFYMNRTKYPWDYFTSLFLPTASTLHIIPIHTSLTHECKRAEVIEFNVSPNGLARLRSRLADDYKLDAQGAAIPEVPNYGPRGQFFRGSETYIFPKTCNLWAASHLQTAGVPLRVTGTMTAGNLCGQGRKCGKLVAPLQLPREIL